MRKIAIFAAGCFWGVQYEFDKVDGVIATTAGYIGGPNRNPTYEEVCARSTGHLEAVRVEYDATNVDFTDLLRVFWELTGKINQEALAYHTGQYRPGFFYSDLDQFTATLEFLIQAPFTPAKNFVVIMPASTFWPAEAYHQKYFEKNPDQLQCH